MYKPFSTSALCLALVLLSACGGSSKDDKDPAQSQFDFTDVIASAKHEKQRNNSAAVSIAIYKDGEIVFAEAFGNNKLEGGDPVTQDTLFQIGSTTKMFTALATMKLVDNGMIRLEDTLTTAIPSIEHRIDQTYSWSDITIHHLLTHQSGFVDEYPDVKREDTLQEYMVKQFGKTEQLMVNAGRFHNYSNPNYSYLGALVEYYSQQQYYEFMRESVFIPLGMTRTVMQKEMVLADGDFALGVFENSVGEVQGYTVAEDIENYIPIVPAGFYTWSTPTEVLKMADFLLKGNNEILSDSLRREIIKKQISLQTYGLPLYYGYGVYVDDGFMYDDEWYQEPIWQHGGNREGYTSKLWILPEKNIAISILSSGSGDDYTSTMIEAIESVVSLPTPVEIPIRETDTSTFDRHVGTYQFGEITLEISNNGDELGMVIPEFDTSGIPYLSVLQPIAYNTFIGSQQSQQFEVTFFPSENSNNDSIYIRNRYFVAIREGF